MPDGSFPPRPEPPPMRSEIKPSWGEFALFMAFGLALVCLFAVGLAITIMQAPG